MHSRSPLPAGKPLFMVDHGFAKKSKSWTGNVRNKTLYGLSVTSDPASKRSRNTKRKFPARTLQVFLETSDPTLQLTKGIQHSSGDDKVDQVQPWSTAAAAYTTAPISPFVQSPEASLDLPAPSCPGTASALYGLNALESIKGLEFYMTYYLEIIGDGLYPMERRMRMQDNPIRWSWFPLAFEDDLWLKNIIIVAATDHAKTANMQKPQGTFELMQSFITQLNDRISKQDFSDGTIGSVSCLSTIEHASGNHDMAKVHLRGMAEMIKARGGLDSIPRERRTKIMRADIIRSADLLELPMLPRIPRSHSSVEHTSHVNGQLFSKSLGLLLRSGATIHISHLCWTLTRTTQMIEAVWHNAQSLETMTYYEDIICLHYDLLVFKPGNVFERACRISFLTFIQPLYRYWPFSRTSAQSRSSALRDAMKDLESEGMEFSVRLWLYTIGSIGSQETEERDWFRTGFEEAVRAQGEMSDCTWDTIKTHLQQVAWTDVVHNHLGETLFADVFQKFPTR